MSQHHNIGLILNNARNPFQAARIISYATEKTDSEIKVTGLVAGDQMRGCAVQRYLSHVEIRNLQLTPIEGGHTDRSNDPFIRMFLSLPAAADSGHPPPATPEHGVRVDLRAPSIVRARAGRPPRQSPSRAPCRAVLVGPQAQPLPSAQLGGGWGGGTGLPLDCAGGAGLPGWPPPSAPAAPAGQTDSQGAPGAAATGQPSYTNGSAQQPVSLETRQQSSAVAAVPELLTVEQTATQTVVGGPGDEIRQIGEQDVSIAVFPREIDQTFTQRVNPPNGQFDQPSAAAVQQTFTQSVVGGPGDVIRQRGEQDVPCTALCSREIEQLFAQRVRQFSPPSAAGGQPPGQAGTAGGTPPSPAQSSSPPSPAQSSSSPPPSAAVGWAREDVSKKRRCLNHENPATPTQPHLARWPGTASITPIRLPFAVINQTVYCGQASPTQISQNVHMLPAQFYSGGQGGLHWSQLSGTWPSTQENVWHQEQENATPRLPSGSDPMLWGSMGCPQPFSCSRKKPKIGPKVSARELLCENKRLHALVAELQASRAKTEADHEMAALMAMRESTGLKSQLSVQTERVSCAFATARDLKRKADTEAARANRAEEKVQGLIKTVDALRKTADRALKSRGQRVSVSDGGIRRPVHQVRATSRADGGKRMALEQVFTTTKGSFSTRTMGGLQYRRAECVFAMQSDVDEGIGSRSSRNKREEANMYRRAAADGASVDVVLCPRPGHTMRRKPPVEAVQVFSRPSLTTMQRVIRPLFRNLMYGEARERLSSANTVVLITDGKMFGGSHACGVLLCMYFMEPGNRIDPFGNGPETRSVLPVPLQLQMVCNKMVKDMRDRHGNLWALQTPFHVIRALRLAGLEDVAKKFGHMLCATTDAAGDNRGLGKTKETMDNMSGKNSLLEALMVSGAESGREWAEADKDLQRRGLLEILIVFNHGNEVQVRQLTRNLYALRKAERKMREVRREARKTGNSLGETDSPVNNLLAAAAQAVGAARAKLAADAAAAVALIAASQPTLAVSGSPAPLPPSAPKEPEPIRLQLSGPLMQVPETVRRIFHLYEEKHVRPLLERQTLLRWWMRRWLWVSHLKRRVRLRIEIEVMEILTAIEILKLEVEIDVLEYLIEILILKPDVQRWGVLIQALKDLGQDLINLAKTLRDLRARKVNFRIRTFRIQSLAAWAQDLTSGKKKKGNQIAAGNETNISQGKPSKANTVKQLKLQRRCSQASGNKFLVDCPAFDLQSKDVWLVIFKFVDVRIRILLPAAVKVSMPESPSRFLPLIEQRRDEDTGEIRYHGHAQQCQNHAANNILDPCIRFLDHEILDRIIQGARCLKNIFNEDELMAAIDHLFSNDPACREIDKHTDFFKNVREAVASQAAAGRGMSLEEVKQQMGYTDERGAQKTETCAIVRWSTTTKAADWQATWRIAYAFGLMRIGGIAFDQQTEEDAAVSLFSYDGFRSELFQSLMLEKKVAETFEMLTGSRTLVQLFLLKFLNRFLFKPLMLVMGDNLECGDLMVGMGSIPRRMLRVLRRILFVGGSWSRKLVHGHRTDGAEYTLSECIRFMNPLCGDRVRQMMGDGWDDPMHASILEGMVNASSELIAAFRTLALKKDPLMPQEAELIFMKSHPDLFGDPSKDASFCLRMTKMQFLAQQVIQDTAEQLAYCVRQNLQGVRAFIAGMMQTRWTFGYVSCKPDGKNLVCSAINYAHEMALADAVIVLKLGDEMMHETKTAIEALARKNPAMQNKVPFVFWPAYVADAFGVEGKKDTQRFLGISDEQKRDGGWGDHYNHLDSLNCVADSAGKLLSLHRFKVQVQKESPVPTDLYLYPLEWIQTLYWGFHPWWLRKNTSMHQNYVFKWNRASELPKPLQEFPSAYRPSVKASNFSVSAKRLEQHWAYPALMYATRSQMNNESLTHFFSLPAFRHMTPADLMEKTQNHMIAASQEMAQFAGLKQTFEVDKERRSVMKEDAHRALGEKARKSGTWGNSRHGGEYRRPGHAGVDPNTKQGRKTLKKVNKLVLVVGMRRGNIFCAQPKSAGIQKRAPRQSAGAQKQPRKRPLAKQVSLSFKERAAAAAAKQASAAKRASAVKPRPQRRSVAAGGGRRAPRTGGNFDIRRQRQKVASRASEDEDGDGAGDPDFVPPDSEESGLTGLETGTVRRSARLGGGCKGTVRGGGGCGDDDSDSESDSGGDDDGDSDSDPLNPTSVKGHEPSLDSGPVESEDNDSDLGLDRPLKPTSRPPDVVVQRPVETLDSGSVDNEDSDPDSGLDQPLRPKPTLPDVVQRPVETLDSGPVDKEDSDPESMLDQPLRPKSRLPDGAQRPCVPERHGRRQAAHHDGDAGAKAGEAAERKRPARGGGRGGQLHASTPADSDDEETYLHNLTLNKEQASLTLPKNIWSFDFAATCGHLVWYAAIRGSNKQQRQAWLMKETDTAVFSGGCGRCLEATITRRASPYLRALLDLKQFSSSASRDVKITFTARCMSGRNYYLMYDSFAGVVIVNVEEIMRPQKDTTGNVDEDEKWKETFVYRRVFDTRDAATKAKGKKNHGVYMGENYFRQLLKEEENSKTETFHEGDSTYKGDIRTLVGVVRWQKAGQNDFPKDYFTEYTEADLFHRGESVHQNPKK